MAVAWRCMTSDPAAKGSAKGLEVAGAGPVHCHFSLSPLSFPCVVPNVVFQCLIMPHPPSYRQRMEQ